MDKEYKLVTNFEEERLLSNYIALKAVGIKNYIICKTARDVFGNVLPGYLALYFHKNTSVADKELFWNTFLFVEQEQKKEGASC